MDPWNIVYETSGVSNCHIANCTGSAIKMWHTTMEMDQPAITVRYDNMPWPSPLPSDQVADQISDWVHSIIIGDWVIVQYDNVRYPGEVTNIKGEDIQVNVIVPAGKHAWKWPKRTEKDLSSRNLIWNLWMCYVSISRYVDEASLLIWSRGLIF